MAEEKSKDIEREYVIPLRGKYQHAVRYKKTPKAIKSVKEFIARHMKVYDKDFDKIKLDKYVNEYLWARGIKNPPHKIKVKVKKNSEGIVNVELVDLPDKLKFKKAREEKQSKEAKESLEKKKTLKEKMQESLKGTKSEAKEKSPDENQDGIEDKKEEEIKEKESAKATEKAEKELSKKEKHTSKVKTPKAEKNEKTEYNKSSRGQ